MRDKIKARQWLRDITHHGSRITFGIIPAHGGIVGSLTGLGHIRRSDDRYTLTRKGARWIGVEPRNDCPA